MANGFEKDAFLDVMLTSVYTIVTKNRAVVTFAIFKNQNANIATKNCKMLTVHVVRLTVE